MLTATKLAKTQTVERLIKLWAERYTVDLSSFYSDDPTFYNLLLEATSPTGRALTAAKLRDSLVDLKCQMAGIQAKSLYEYIPNVLNLSEARRLTPFAFQVYKKLLEVYQQQSFNVTSPLARLMAVGGSGRVALSVWGIPDIEQLATTLEPILLECQEQHVAAKDWRTLGFITTQFNFSNELLLHNLTPVEKSLLGPYLKFVEEQVALPWQRVCAAAAKHQIGSPAFTLVEQMLPVAEEIAQNSYCQMIQRFPHHRSRRGQLDHPGVTHSCLRDLQMFQSYLWLSILEESRTPIDQELVSLCVLVMQSVEVKWELIEQWSQLLMAEITSRLQPEQKLLLLPYAQAMEQAFFNARHRLGATA